MAKKTPLQLQILIGSLLSIILLSLFIHLAYLASSNTFDQLDVSIIHLIYAFRNPALTQVMFIISHLGGRGLVIPTIAISLFLFLKERIREAILLSGSVALSGLAGICIKWYIQKPRPDLSPLYDIRTYSFPSSHTMNSVVFYGMYAYLLFQFTRNKRLSILVSIFLSLVVLLIGVSRIYLGVHYPSDVLGGLIGGLWCLITVLLINKVVQSKSFRA